jgi:ArsR family metal-binding transcriptional regulator
MPDDLIADYQIDLIEDHHSFGSGRYGLHVRFSVDISVCLPYLNAVLDDTEYDHENGILIGARDRSRFAFRRHEIHLGVIQDPANARSIAGRVVQMVNRVWQDRDRISQSLARRKVAPVYDFYKSLPRTNCRRCGYPTCLAFASDLHAGTADFDSCPLLLQEEYAKNKAQVLALLPPRRID